MTIRQKEDGTLVLNQGDSGFIHIDNLDATQTYDVYVAFTDKNRVQIGQQVTQHVEQVAEVDIFIPTELTDLMVVPAKRQSETFYYGVKISKLDDQGNVIEDTIIPPLGQQKVVIVYPKWVEGPTE